MEADDDAGPMSPSAAKEQLALMRSRANEAASRTTKLQEQAQLLGARAEQLEVGEAALRQQLLRL